MRWTYVLFLLAACLSGCSQGANDEEEELRTVPVTNNPLLLPSGAQQLPGMPMGTPR